MSKTIHGESAELWSAPALVVNPTVPLGRSLDLESTESMVRHQQSLEVPAVTDATVFLNCGSRDNDSQ
jgi:hypothetical protein